MVKIDLITGFLGSGKTTFIREYAKYLMSKGEKICIIENDYGAVNIDMVLLQDLLGDNCNLEMIVGGDGKEAHRRRFRTKLISMGMSGYDRVIIEPSGIYDADEFFDVLYDEPLDRWYEIGSVISIVDAESVLLLEGTSKYLFMSEIAWAGKLLLSKVDETTDVGQIHDFINATMEEYGCSVRFELKDIYSKSFDSFSQDEFDSIENAGYRRASYTKKQIDDSHYQPLFYFDVEMGEGLLKETARKLLADERAGKVIRIKGFVKTSDSTQVEINATEKEIKIEPVTSSRNAIIIIGEHLDKDYINEIWKDYCAVVSL
ncbi:GTPase, G3E family [Butyrivibrio proteoclasticus]|uniref:GTPase, G3E family n=1 Tax=Butyrivibrio proteoclasticus TaxID=43305 RepID=A0A1I5XGM3_9FIRM|nr:GTP-binding protein [Butyrivibrio proteoclasticus]SFQ31111.1 GTPase, G3E family [Butyrivibrio proteoclasticus]